MDLGQAFGAGLTGFLKGKQFYEQNKLRRELARAKSQPDALDQARLDLIKAQRNALLNKPDEIAKGRLKQIDDVIGGLATQGSNLRSRLSSMDFTEASNTANAFRRGVQPQIASLAQLYDSLPDEFKIPGMKGIDYVGSRLNEWMGEADFDGESYLKAGLPFKDPTPELTTEYNKLVSEMAETGPSAEAQKSSFAGFLQRAKSRGLTDQQVLERFPFAQAALGQRPVTRQQFGVIGQPEEASGTFSADAGLLGNMFTGREGDKVYQYGRDLPQGVFGDGKFFPQDMPNLGSQLVDADVTRTSVNNLMALRRPFGILNFVTRPEIRAELRQYGRDPELMRKMRNAFDPLLRMDVMQSLGITDPSQYGTPEGFAKAMDFVEKTNPDITSNEAFLLLPQWLRQGKMMRREVGMKPVEVMEQTTVPLSKEAQAKIAATEQNTRLANARTKAQESIARVMKATESAKIEGERQKPSLAKRRMDLSEARFNNDKAWREFLKSYYAEGRDIQREGLSLQEKRFTAELPQVFSRFAGVLQQGITSSSITLSDLGNKIMQAASDMTSTGGGDQQTVGQIAFQLGVIRDPSASRAQRQTAISELYRITTLSGRQNPVIAENVIRYVQESDRLEKLQADYDQAMAGAEILTKEAGQNLGGVRITPGSRPVRSPFSSEPFTGAPSVPVPSLSGIFGSPSSTLPSTPNLSGLFGGRPSGGTSGRSAGSVRNPVAFPMP